MIDKFIHSYSLLNLKNKILLYASPILIIVFVYINLEQAPNTNISSANQVKTKQIKRYYSNNKLLKIISNLASKSKIKISKLDIANKKITLQSQSDIKNILSFIEQTSSQIQIKTFSISKSEELFSFSIVFSNKLVFLQDSKAKIGVKMMSAFQTQEEASYAPSAIFASWVHLNGEWLKAGDKYEHYIVKKVYPKKIILFDTKMQVNVTKIIIKE